VCNHIAISVIDILATEINSETLLAGGVIVSLNSNIQSASEALVGLVIMDTVTNLNNLDSFVPDDLVNTIALFCKLKDDATDPTIKDSTNYDGTLIENYVKLIAASPDPDLLLAAITSAGEGMIFLF
jgi:hypothetical protein